MAKEKFLLVSLNESKTKELAQAVTNDTCRKILDHLADKEATESELSKKLELPISTVHYNLQLLVKAGLIITDEFHYSEKGKEVNHYKLANKYIIIAPKSTWGLKEKLKSVLPVAILVGAVGTGLQLLAAPIRSVAPLAKEANTFAMDAVAEAAPVQETIMECFPSIYTNAAAWFLLGALSTIVFYLLVDWYRNK